MVAEVGGIILKHSKQDERADLTGNDVVAAVEGQQLLEELLTLTVLHVETDDAGQQTSQSMAVGGRGLLQGTLEEMRPSELTLVLRGLLPVLGHQAQSLDGGELADTSIGVCEGDFDEEKQGLDLGVVVLLEIGGDGLDLLSVGFCLVSVAVGEKRLRARGWLLTDLAALQQLGKLVLVHLDQCATALTELEY
jgi:hypothetical protein